MFRRTALGALALVATASLLPACSPGDPDLLVELKTDLIPVVEFSRIRTIVRRSDGTTASREQDNPAMADVDYITGRRVAEFADLTPGGMTVRVELFGPDGRQFIERSVRVNLQQSVGATVIITRSCRGVLCPDSASVPAFTECLGGSCVSPECVAGDEEACGEPQCRDAGDCISPAPCAAALCENGVCFARALLDGCPADQYCDAAIGCLDLPEIADAGAPDGGDAGGCAVDSDCDDGLDCTIDTCDAGDCVTTTDDSACTDGTGGACIDGFGCQYDGCSPATCVAGACETARCDGDACTIESACGAGEMCCGDACVAAGCDDANPCTDDSCGATGCTNAPNSAACDDGVFCNGSDTCSGGSCSGHAGDPCGGGTTCDEAVSSCVGCVVDADCPASIVGLWGSCSGFSGTCDETGTRSRTTTTFSCSGSTCVRDDTMETGACTRVTESLTCGTTTFSGWSACGSYTGTCDETGERTRTRTDRNCRSATCQDEMSPDTGSCSRDTDGSSCGSTTYGTWGACGGYSDTCDEGGTRSRSQTDQVCVLGSCDEAVGTDVGSCSRDTDGTMCGSTTYGAWGPCGGFATVCDETGSRTRTQTERTCSTGTCDDVPGTDVGSCTRDTDGNSCDNEPLCQTGTCDAGTCDVSGPPCTFPSVCCEPGICVCSSCGCP